MGTDVVIFKYFRQKLARKMAFLTQNEGKLCEKLIKTLVIDKNAQNLAKILAFLTQY
jgi:hypothetical protein